MTINCKGRLIDLSTPKVMGILNLTPDSFYDGGKYRSERDILIQVEKMLSQGTTFIDLGAYSSRPGATHISEEEELKRLIPVVELLINQFPKILLSIDTFRSNVATKSIEAGASMINDISGGEMDTLMFETVGKLQVPYILMHMQGTPQNMQEAPTYDNLLRDIMHYFAKKTEQLRLAKVNDIILDVGFGFGKTIDHNYELLSKLGDFNHFELPLLTGVSRKSMLYKLLNIDASKALNATTVANTIALLAGTKILRVHDVQPAIEAIKITNHVKQ